MCSGPFSGAQGHSKPQTRAERRSHMDWKCGEVAPETLLRVKFLLGWGWGLGAGSKFERPAATSADPKNEFATQ